MNASTINPREKPWTLMFLKSIRSRLRFSFIGISLVIIIIISTLSYFNGRSALRDEAIAGLEALRETRIEQVELWFSDRERDVSVLAQNPTVVLSTRAFVNNVDTSDNLGTTRTERMQALADQYRGQPDLEGAEEQSIYSTTHTRFHSFYRTTQLSYTYIDILVVSNDGNVVYSAQKNDDFQTNLLRDYPTSAITLAFQNALKTNETAFNDFAYYEPASQIALFFASPVKDDKSNTIGILVVGIPVDPFDKLLGLRASLGKTGETYVVGEDFLFRNNSLYLDELEVSSTILNSDITVKTDATRSALAGETNTEIIQNYRGTNVLSTWHPLTLYAGSRGDTQQIHWALVVEKSISEVDQPINDLLASIVLISLILMILILWMTYWLANQISRPILELTQAAEQITKGNLEQKVSIQSSDEVGILAIAFNQMTDQLRKSMEELQSATEAATESSRLKSEFLATMSHELRTPLNAILGFTGVMLNGLGVEINEKSRFMLERVEANGKRLLNLINDILDISRIEAGHTELEPDVVNIRNSIHAWGESILVLVEEKGLDFTISISETLPTFIYADQNVLTKIASNLLSNAIKFTEQGTVSLTVDGNEKEWSIEVKDTGIGIADNAKRFIFDAFRQVDGTYARSYGGTGLGLAIVSRLVMSMNGTIEVESKIGEGSRFIVKLPIQNPELEMIADE